MTSDRPMVAHPEVAVEFPYYNPLPPYGGTNRVGVVCDGTNWTVYAK